MPFGAITGGVTSCLLFLEDLPPDPPEGAPDIVLDVGPPVVVANGLNPLGMVPLGGTVIMADCGRSGNWGIAMGVVVA